VEEAEGALGKMTPLLERSVFNPRTKRYFGFPEFWSPNPINYRIDLWDTVGARPGTWEEIRSAGPRLKAMGHPLGLGFSQDLDSNLTCFSIMSAYGAFLQDEDGRLTINSPATVEAVRTGAAIFQSGMTDEVLAWEAASNNRFLASGKGSLIQNPVSALRAIEKQDADLAGRVRFAPVPAGPAQRLGASSFAGVYVIWTFARNQEAAKRFLVDLARGYREAFVRSEWYNLPAFPGAVPDLAEVMASDPAGQPKDKYALLAQGAEWSTNVGYPGYAHGAVDELFNQHLIPRMFAAAATGELTPADAVAAAEAGIKPIFDRWREMGKI
jgi:multiple sugar transport system substrate-binding protein